jgi:enoyl-CoA hydratase/carnithine racemase
MDAESAARWGLINKVVPAAQLMDTALDYARRLARNGPLALQAAKELALRGRDMSLAGGLRMEQFVNYMLQQTADSKEGKAAFAEKRAPKYTGK